MRRNWPNGFKEHFLLNLTKDLIRNLEGSGPEDPRGFPFIFKDFIKNYERNGPRKFQEHYLWTLNND